MTQKQCPKCASNDWDYANVGVPHALLCTDCGHLSAGQFYGESKKMKVCRHFEDGKVWARIEDYEGNVWDEPITGWSVHISLIDGSTEWKHIDGRTGKDWI